MTLEKQEKPKSIITKNPMADVTIYCPNVGVIQGRGDKRRAKFIIVPKDEYVRKYPKFVIKDKSWNDQNKNIIYEDQKEAEDQLRSGSPFNNPK